MTLYRAEAYAVHSELVQADDDLSVSEWMQAHMRGFVFNGGNAAYEIRVRELTPEEVAELPDPANIVNLEDER